MLGLPLYPRQFRRTNGSVKNVAVFSLSGFLTGTHGQGPPIMAQFAREIGSSPTRTSTAPNDRLGLSTRRWPSYVACFAMYAMTDRQGALTPEAGVARTCSLGPRLLVVDRGRTADLQDRSALPPPDFCSSSRVHNSPFTIHSSQFTPPMRIFPSNRHYRGSNHGQPRTPRSE